jgi:hypothetical protein
MYAIAQSARPLGRARLPKGAQDANLPLDYDGPTP